MCLLSCLTLLIVSVILFVIRENLVADNHRYIYFYVLFELYGMFGLYGMYMAFALSLELGAV